MSNKGFSRFYLLVVGLIRILICPNQLFTLNFYHLFLSSILFLNIEFYNLFINIYFLMEWLVDILFYFLLLDFEFLIMFLFFPKFGS